MAIQMSKVYRQHYDKLVDKTQASVPEQYIPFLLDYAAYKTKSGRGYYQYEEILSIVMSAAVKASRTFKAGLGDFSTYVKPFINGAIVDYYRDSSKRTADTKRKILAFISAHHRDTGKFPTEYTIMQELRISKTAFNMALESVTRQMTEVDEVACVQHTTESNIIFDSVKRIFEMFDPKVAEIFSLKFFDEESDNQIALLLNIPIKQVQSIIAQNIDELRERLEDNHITLESYYESLAVRADY